MPRSETNEKLIENKENAPPNTRKRKQRRSRPSIADIFARKRDRSRSTDNIKKLKADELNSPHETEINDTSTEEKDNTDCNENNYVTSETMPPLREDIEIEQPSIAINDLSDSNQSGQESEDDFQDVNTEIKIDTARIEKANERCHLCKQFLNNSDIKCFQGHPQNAVEEFIALRDDKLVLTAVDKSDIEEVPQTNVTYFSIFDKEGHLCPIDSGLLEADVELYMSGYLKSICSQSADIDDECVPVKDCGPLTEWWSLGFDRREKNGIIIATQFGEYNLLKPSEEYAPIMNNLYEKNWISKMVVEYLEEFYYLEPTYEDLLEIILKGTIPELNDTKITEDMLHKHAQYVCDTVVSFHAEEDDEKPLITLPCMRELIKLVGVKLGKGKTHTGINLKKEMTKDRVTFTKATTTRLVRKTFEVVFKNQIDDADMEVDLRRKRCEVCETCQQPDCGKCNSCRDMVKFGGSGCKKQCCIKRICPNMRVQHAEDSDHEDEEQYREEAEEEAFNMDDSLPVKFSNSDFKDLVWLGDTVKIDSTRKYFSKVSIEGLEVENGDFVMIESSAPSIPALVGRIVYMWQERITPKLGYFHAEVFMRSCETVLGKVGDPNEIFLADRCVNAAPLSSILRKANVERRDTPTDWFTLGGKDVVNKDSDYDDGLTYYYQKSYEPFTARFEDIPTDPVCPVEIRKHRFCPSCERKAAKQLANIPIVVDKLSVNSDLVKDHNFSEWAVVKWRGIEYRKGCGVYLKPDTFKLKTNNPTQTDIPLKHDKVDEDIYTEYYRKSDNNVRGSNVDTCEPFNVGCIAAVIAKGVGPLIHPQDIYLRVYVMYRPENTNDRFPHRKDLNLVYWSDEIRDVPFSNVTGTCQLVYEKDIPDLGSKAEWIQSDPNRFYFREAYNKSTGKFITVPREGVRIGLAEKTKDKGKGKGSKPHEQKKDNVPFRPLRTLDVFAGCGGLSEGLHQAGIAECKWAIENVEPTAHAYSLNNKDCTVFNEDCNALLKDAIAGRAYTGKGLKIPQRGEVELLCGGPPCQGFSGMNRFNSREYSSFQNSLVASLLSYCDFYRPKYFILENVRNFVAYKNGMVLKLTLRCLLEMGYQSTFGILQAGNYGVPQTRRRLIILAAAPGLKLPLYPEPTHVFSGKACTLSASIDGKKFTSNITWDESAPRRTCTIQDAMSDLPEIENGANQVEIEYGCPPESHFQRLVRGQDTSVKLRDHICKNMAPLIQARMCRIPTAPGSDWRDLPNTSVTLSDGSKSKVLQYRHLERHGKSQTGKLRGVCACATGMPCDPNDKQENTLIPWCLPHTGNRHNHWAGLYGRIAWDGYFSTTVTNPEPMGKQGRVLHPEQHRVVSVRECARSQGFPDSYQFAGSIQDKHRQIGNAVPPPLAAALGREIKRACSSMNSL